MKNEYCMYSVDVVDVDGSNVKALVIIITQRILYILNGISI